MAKETATALLEKAKEDSALQTAADEKGMTVEESGYLATNTSTNEESSFPAALIGEIFKLSGKEPFPAEPRQNAGDFYVFEFVGQMSPEATMTDEDKERYSTAVIQLKQQQILSSWLQGQRQQAKIMTHKSL